MLPGILESIVYLLLGCFIFIVGFLTEKINQKLGYACEITGAILVGGFLIYYYGFSDSFIFISLVSTGYLSMFLLWKGQAKFSELKKEIIHLKIEEIIVVRNSKRITADLLISMIVFSGAVLFLIYGPEYSLLKFIIIYGLLMAITEMIKRVVTYFTTKVYYSEEQDALYILSYLESRKLPIKDMQSITIESTADLLKLHPYLTLFTSNADFTTSFHKALRLQMPGETVYLTMRDTAKWKRKLEVGVQPESTMVQEVTVLPFYHKKNIKRLLGKLYFAVTVKGVSAYTGILLLLYYLETPVWLMICTAVVYWITNLYFSDRVLKVAMDAKPIDDPAILSAAERVFAKAGIPNVLVYETDSAQYNGLATGMNIGRAMVTLTSATLKLPIEAIEGILAHEAVHVKKRDVMWGQIYRALSLLIAVFGLLFLIEQITDIEAFIVPLFILIWFLMILFPVSQSFCHQLFEVRADHLGSTFLDGGKRQMADSLATLATNQDEALRKSGEYSYAKKDLRESKSSLERPSWVIRLLEFQIMVHPPMYWRVKILRNHEDKWGKSIRRRWMIDRMRESFTK